MHTSIKYYLPVIDRSGFRPLKHVLLSCRYRSAFIVGAGVKLALTQGALSYTLSQILIKQKLQCNKFVQPPG